jgi:SAM-dependent methyltransferase
METETPGVEPRRLNVGCGRNAMNGWINLDSQKLPGVDIVADLERCAELPLPLDDDSIDEILMSHVIEHVREPLPMMQELHRVARPGAKATIRVPYGSNDGAWEDPTHVRPYFLQSFGYFSQPYYWRADYGYRGDWQPKLITLVMDGKIYGKLSWDVLMEKIRTLRNAVGEMVCRLEAVKPIRPPRRELQALPAIRIEFFDLDG